MTKQYDPHWPFPQFNEDGTPLLPPDFDKAPKGDQQWPWDMGEAML